MSLFSPADTLEILGFKTPDFKQPAFKYTSCEAFLSILRSQRFRFSSPDTFDDTYELSFDRLDPNISPEEYEAILAKYVQSTPVEESIEIPSFEENVRQIPIEKFHMVHEYFYKIIKSSAMIFCSTSTSFSEHMWRNYADNEAGVCFAFKLEPDMQQFKEFTLVSRRINYTDDIVRYKQFSSNLEEITLATYNWIFSKERKYHRENEIRTYLYRNINHIVDLKNQYCFFPFRKENILEVYFGAKSTENISEIIKTLKENGYTPKLYKMVNVGGSFTPIQLSNNFGY